MVITLPLYVLVIVGAEYVLRVIWSYDNDWSDPWSKFLNNVALGLLSDLLTGTLLFVALDTYNATVPIYHQLALAKHTKGFYRAIADSKNTITYVVDITAGSHVSHD